MANLILRLCAAFNFGVALMYGPLGDSLKLPQANWDQAIFSLVLGIWLLNLSKED